MLILFNSKSEISAIHQIFTKELDFFICPIDIKTQKIDKIMLNIYKIGFTAFLVIDQINCVRFFEKTFLVINVGLEIVFKYFFLS